VYIRRRLITTTFAKLDLLLQLLPAGVDNTAVDIDFWWRSEGISHVHFVRTYMHTCMQNPLEEKMSLIKYLLPILITCEGSLRNTKRAKHQTKNTASLERLLSYSPDFRVQFDVQVWKRQHNRLPPNGEQKGFGRPAEGKPCGHTVCGERTAFLRRTGAVVDAIMLSCLRSSQPHRNGYGSDSFGQWLITRLD